MVILPIPQSRRPDCLHHAYRLLSSLRILAVAALIGANVVWGGSPAASKAYWTISVP